jgi:hypothetical protein
MKLKDRLEELEKRVKELEQRPIVYPPVYIPQPYPVPWPYYYQPLPVPYWHWRQTTYGDTVQIGSTGSALQCTVS